VIATIKQVQGDVPGGLARFARHSHTCDGLRSNRIAFGNNGWDTDFVSLGAGDRWDVNQSSATSGCGRIIDRRLPPSIRQKPTAAA